MSIGQMIRFGLSFFTISFSFTLNTLICFFAPQSVNTGKPFETAFLHFGQNYTKPYVPVNILYHLSTCSTCKRIVKELQAKHPVTLREIKSVPLSLAEVERLAAKAGSYEAIFSRRAIKFRELGLHLTNMGEMDYKRYLLEDYTFLKRPVLETESAVTAGNSKTAVEAMLKSLGN